MTKVLRKKPGPKSSKQNQMTLRNGLGESSSNSGDTAKSPDNSSDKEGSEVLTPRDSKRLQSNADVSQFRTPDIEECNTDYGLEFTTSHIENPSPRRCSTFKSPDEGQQIGRDSESTDSRESTETNTPLVTNNKSTSKERATKTITIEKPSSSKQAEVLRDTNATNQLQTGDKTKENLKKKRKQRNPLQLEMRFLKDVQALQERTDNLIPMLPFSRLVRELMHNSSTEVTKITPTALEALQTSSELYLTQRLQDAYMLTLHRGRVTLDVRDMQLINYLKI